MLANLAMNIMQDMMRRPTRIIVIGAHCVVKSCKVNQWAQVKPANQIRWPRSTDHCSQYLTVKLAIARNRHLAEQGGEPGA